MLRRHKTDRRTAQRILVVDDNPDAAKLVGKLLRQAAYEVAEIGDQQVALATLVNEPAPVAAVVASFTTAGTSAGLRLLDAIRNHPESTVNSLRVLIIADSGRQKIFCMQAGADALVQRPYAAEDLLDELAALLDRPDEERSAHRQRVVAEMQDAADAAAN